jgi:DNA polymerase-3 subunit beta
VNFTLVCRQIEGKYPNYNAVIPTNNDKKIIVDRQSFLSAVRRVSIYANDATELMKFEISAGKMEISADDLEFSVAAKETMVCQYDGEPIRIGFKAKFIQSIVKNIDSNEIIISLVDSSRAGLILPVENVENTELLSLVMPMILND